MEKNLSFFAEEKIGSLQIKVIQLRKIHYFYTHSVPGLKYGQFLGLCTGQLIPFCHSHSVIHCSSKYELRYYYVRGTVIDNWAIQQNKMNSQGRKNIFPTCQLPT